ncbi:hypothetical protein HON36_04445 [Candidatus Parcubacteria bacterium]|jgi:hypothetical protein|nr:hypothetical protein [Candidatus Parcubacteria bacterium]MBT7228277.1 hypothetical protein [Candidatus Parcubacteria bacterium]
MPRLKTTAPKTAAKRVVKKNEDALDDFEQFLAQSPKKSNNRGNKGWLFVTLLIVIVVLGGALLYMSKNTEIEKEQPFKTVFIDNGESDQIYFAKVVREDAYYIYLEDIYVYVQEPRFGPPVEEGGEPELLGYEEVLRSRNSNNYMQVNRDKVIAIEELEETAGIMQEIGKLKSAVQ